MAERILLNELEESMTQLKTKVLAGVASKKLAASYAMVIDGFVQFCQHKTNNSSSPQAFVEQYYEQVTKAKPYSRPETAYLKKLARPIFIIRDEMTAQPILNRYSYDKREIPHAFGADVQCYEHWLVENNYADETVTTRIGRIKQFLFDFYDAGNESLFSLTPEIFASYIGRLNGRYTSVSKTNMLYTIKNYFSCPHIGRQLNFDPAPFLSNLHANKHERLDSCYTPAEIRQVLNAADRATAKGKMFYLMMLLASVYGLRVGDIRTMRFSNIDWKRRVITLNQHKTGRYLELPIIQEVLLAMLDYVKNGRPNTNDSHIFIKQRSPHVPYSKNNHFAGFISEYFEKAGVYTEGKHSGLHSMRHSLATSLLAEGVQINEIADILGHASPQSTTRYLWSDIEQLRTAAQEVVPYVK